MQVDLHHDSVKRFGNCFENILSVDALQSFQHRNVRIKLQKASLFLSSHDSGSSELKKSSPSSWILRDQSYTFRAHATPCNVRLVFFLQVILQKGWD